MFPPLVEPELETGAAGYAGSGDQRHIGRRTIMSPKVVLEKKRPLHAERPVGVEGIVHLWILDDDVALRRIACEIECVQRHQTRLGDHQGSRGC
jgi:hypothetical protein